ncbi:MAG: hypothetical protein J0M07_19510 [Anaerolineae bacterium]|nr:hypothetical protein [Anaerolineae bacterium]
MATPDSLPSHPVSADSIPEWGFWRMAHWVLRGALIGTGISAAACSLAAAYTLTSAPQPDWAALIDVGLRHDYPLLIVLIASFGALIFAASGLQTYALDRSPTVPDQPRPYSSVLSLGGLLGVTVLPLAIFPGALVVAVLVTEVFLPYTQSTGQGINWATQFPQLLVVSFIGGLVLGVSLGFATALIASLSKSAPPSIPYLLLGLVIGGLLVLFDLFSRSPMVVLVAGALGYLAGRFAERDLNSAIQLLNWRSGLLGAALVICVGTVLVVNPSAGTDSARVRLDVFLFGVTAIYVLPQLFIRRPTLAR